MSEESKLNTDCKKCGTPMSVPKNDNTSKSIIRRLTVTITNYRCEKCGHWNDLKRRKGWKRS